MMMDPFGGCNKLREDSKLSFGQLHVIAWVDMESLFIGVDIGYNVSEVTETGCVGNWFWNEQIILPIKTH